MENQQENLKIQAKRVKIIPFNESTYRDPEMAWIIIDGIAHEYSDYLIQVCMQKGMIIEDLRNKDIPVILPEGEVF